MIVQPPDDGRVDVEIAAFNVFWQCQFLDTGAPRACKPMTSARYKDRAACRQGDQPIRPRHSSQSHRSWSQSHDVCLSDRSLRHRVHALGKTIISVITCPHCGTAKLETMSTNACQFFYICTGWGAMLRPKQVIVVCFVPMARFRARRPRRSVRARRMALTAVAD